MRVDVFDAAKVSDGPVATLRGTNRETVPLLLHSAWMPVSAGLVDAERLTFADEVTEARLATLDDDQRALVNTLIP
jgi:hypothetical protein